MRKTCLKISALLAFVAAWFVSTPLFAQVNVPANLRVSGPVSYPGGSLKGEYWKRPTNTIFTDGGTVPAHRVDTQIAGFGAPSGTFKATEFLYFGSGRNDLSLVRDWLAGDGASFAGTTNNLDDGAFRFTGFLNVAAPGTLNLGTTSDDGARITIGGVDITNGDNGHGDETHDMDAVFEQAGLYPIEITYFNGDWTSDGTNPVNHSGNPDPGVHGGANFHLRVGGADVTPAQVSSLFYPAAPRPPVSVGLNFGADDNGSALGLAATDVAGAVAQANWNNLNGASSAAPVSGLTADSNGVAVATTISVTWTSPNTWSSTGRGEENNGFPAGPDKTLMTGYIDTGDSDATKATVTIDGIPADFTAGGYDVLVYGLGGVAGRGGAYTIGGQTKFGTSPANPTAHVEDPGVDLSDTGTYVRFRGLYTSSFTLTASADASLGAGAVNFRAPINGIQIVKSQDPQAGLAKGYLLKRRFDNIGNSLDWEVLAAEPKYTNNQPDLVCLRTDFSENDSDECDNCGYSVTGVFIPKTSGPHVFYISADDRSALFLSTDENPANKVQIAREPEWAGRRRYIDNTGNFGGGGRGDPPLNRSVPIDLAAGSLYYIEGLSKEAGGGDNLDVAVQGPGDPAVMDGDRPLYGDRIGTFVDLSGSSLSLTQNPASIRVPEGDVASFTVGADAVSPLCGGTVTYQWQRNGVDILGANGASYSFGPVHAEDHLATYRAIVRVPGITRTSSSATLEVLGRECLRVLGAVPSGDLTNVTVQFSTFVNTNLPSTVDPFNYTITGGGGSPAVSLVTVGGDGRSAILTTEGLAENTDYSVAVQNVESIVGSTTCLAPTNTATFHTGVTDPCGGVLFEVYNTGAGNTVSVLTSHPDYPNNPSLRMVIGGFESRLAYADDSHEGYGARMSGVFIPPSSGDWVFYLASDDSSQLFLNPTGLNAAGKIKIQEETGCCNAYSAHKSAAYPLVAGQGYYIEALYKEGTGGDFCRVEARSALEPIPPGGTSPQGSSIPGGSMGYPAAPVGIGGPLVITQQPASQSVNANISVTFSIAATNPNNLPLLYQWQRDGVDIPGANNATYTIPLVSLTDSGAKFRTKVCVIGTNTLSAEATLTVTEDTTPPQCVSASGLISLSNIVVRFNETMAAGPAQDLFNYTVAAHSVVGAVLQADGRSVLLQVDPGLTPDTAYQVVIQNVTDLADNPIAPSPCTLSFRSFTISCGFTLKELYLGLDPATVAIADLRSSPKYPNSPDLVRYGGLLELNTFDEFEGYGARMSGFLLPPVSGNYNFYMSSDDNGEFWLSTDASPANIVQIAREPVWNGRRDWVGTDRRDTNAPENRSTTLFPGGIPLVAGQMYYFEALVKEGGGGDNLAVTWQLPGSPVPASGSPAIPGIYMATLANPAGATLQITQQPTDQSFVIGGGAPTASFSVGITASQGNDTNPPVFYQWYRDNGTPGTNGSSFAPIAGANSATYSLSPVNADNGARFRVQIYIPGATVTSSAATLTVGQQNSPPQFTCGPNQSVSNASPQTVPNWATGILPYTPLQILYSSDFSSLPAGSSVAGNAVVADGVLHLTDAVNSQSGQFFTPAVTGVSIASLTLDFNLRVGGGTCCGAATPYGTSRMADGISVSFGNDLGAGAGEDGTGSGIIVSFDLWDNGEVGAQDASFTAPDIDVRFGGTTLAYQALDGEREGGRAPSGPLITDPATGSPMTLYTGPTGTNFMPVHISLAADGTVDVDFKGVRVINHVQTGYQPLVGPQLGFGGRTGGANANQWIDDLSVVAVAAGAPAGEASQTVKFIVTNSNPSLFLAQPAVSTNGTLSYTPAANANGTANVTVVAMDNGGGSDMSQPCTFTIAVAGGGGGTNACPVANAQSVVAQAGSPVNIVLTASDVENSPLTYAVASGPSHGTLSGTAPNLTYTAAAAYSGPDSFTFTANDGTCTSAPATVSIDVRGTTGGNTPPQFTCGPNQSVSNASPQTVPNWATGILPYTPLQILYGSDFSSLPSGSSVAGNAAVSNGVLHITDAVNGQSGQFFTPAVTGVRIASLTLDFNLRIGGGTCCGAATPYGTSRMADGISVSFGNDLGAGAGEEGTGTGLIVSFDLWDNAGAVEDDAATAPDIDVKKNGSIIAYQAMDGEREGGRAPSGPLITDPATGSPMTLYTGPTGTNFMPVRISLAADGTLNVDFKGVRVINAVQTGYQPLLGPQLGFGGRTGGANANQWIDDLSIVANSADAPAGEAGQTVKFIVSNSNPSLFSAQPAISANGTLSYTPAANANGTANVTVVAMDSGGTAGGGSDMSQPCTFTIAVAGGGVTNACPVANAQSVVAQAGSPVNIVLTATDPENSPLTYAVASGPSHGTLSGTAPNLTYTAAANYSGPDSFTFTANDGTCTSAPATVSIDVRGPINRKPVAQNQSISTAINTPVSFQLLASDPDNDPLQYSVTTPPTHGTVVLQAQTGAASYTPAAGYSGPDSFSFKVNDGSLDSDPATVSITVRSIENHNPVAKITASPLLDFSPSLANKAVIAGCGDHNACVTLDARLSSDPDGDSLTFSWFLEPAPVPFAVGPVVTNCLELGQQTILLSALDGKGGMGTDTVIIEVLNTDEALGLLIDKVNSASIARKNKRPFIATLKAASASIDRGQCNTAANQLHAFQNKVRAQVSRDNPSEAAIWTRWAQYVIDALHQ